MLYWTNPETARKLVDIAVSLDAFTKRTMEFDSVLANYANIQPTLGEPEQVGIAIEEFEKELEPYDGLKGEYLRGTLRALKGFARVMCGDEMSYEEKMHEIMQLPLQKIPDEMYDFLRERVDRQMTDLGYTGKTMDMIAAWKKDWFIPTDEVIDYAKKYVGACKKATLERVTELPEEDGLNEIYGVTGYFWSGHSSYLGDFKGRLRFNLERPWSGPLFINTLAHEGYPGHQVSYCRWDWLFRRGELPVEGSFYMLAAPSNTVFEGLAENGTHFLGWDQPGSPATEVSEDLKKQLALAWDVSDLQRIIQMRACYMCNAEGASKEDVMDYFKKTEVFSEIEGTNTYRFFTHIVQGIQYPCYYYGKWIVRKAWDLCDDTQKKQLFKLLYDTPLSNNTFIKGVEQLTGKTFDAFKGI